LTGAVYNSAGIALTNAQQAALQLDVAGNLKTTTIGGSVTIDQISVLVKNNQVWTVSTDINMAASSTDNPILLLVNPTANTKVFYIYTFYCGVDYNNQRTKFSFYYAPTVTANGTAQTPRNNNIGGGGATTAQAYTLPTVTSNGIRIGAVIIAQNASSYGYFGNFMIGVNPNSKLLITGSPDAINKIAVISLTWAEV
jgi:hypothetical protein